MRYESRYMTSNGLITKLVIAGAVERQLNDLRFTNRLCGHLAQYDPEESLRAGKIDGWRKMLRDFEPSLGSLSDAEISTTITLLDYFLNVVEQKYTR